MKHEPCRVLANAKRLGEFVTADPILAICWHPKSDHSLIHSKRRVFKDGSYLNRELLFAVVAGPDAASLNKRMLCVSATRASYIAAWPAEFNSSLESILRIENWAIAF
jgi:hypothetical protein